MAVVPTPTTPLDPTQPYSSGGTFTLPLDGASTTGPHYVLIASDTFNSVTESNETNNVGVSSPIELALPPLPDLEVLNIVGPPPAAPGSSVEVSWTVRNRGPAPTYANWTERIAVSIDGQIGGDTTVLETVINEMLGPNAQITRSRMIPVLDVGLSYRAVVCLDVNNRNVEENEANNCLIASESTVLRPDLNMTAVIAPTDGVADGTINISWSVMNIGMAAANGLWLDRVYLSLDETLDASDALVASVPHSGPLVAKDMYMASQAVTIPSNFRGDYFVLVVTDATNSVFESGPDSNNRGIASNKVHIEQPDRPNLRVTSLTSPPGGLIGESAEISWTVTNTGAAAASGTWVDRVLLVPSDNPNGGIQVGLLIRPKTLGPDEFYAQSLTIPYPPPAGKYHVAVITDSASTVFEGIDGGENDNREEAPNTFVIGTYNVSVATDFVSGIAGTPVMLAGTATREGTNEPVAHASIGIAVQVRDTRRILEVTTDELGNYQKTFHPIPTESGQYGLAAGPALAVGNVVQDQFTLFGFGVQPLESSFIVHPGKAAITRTLTLRNNGDSSISGLSVQLQGDTAGLDITVDTGGSELGWLEVRPINVTVSASANQTGTRMVELLITSSQGATARSRLNIEVRPRDAYLTASTTMLQAAMLRSTPTEVRQTHVQFDVTNTGGTPTPALEVLASPASWLSITSPTSLPPLAPGERATVVLTLTPEPTLPLDVYDDGEVIVRGAGGTQPFVRLPSVFTCVSDGIGDLTVTVEDEFTYFDPGDPPNRPAYPNVEGATVTISDSRTGAVLGSAVTGADGRATFTQLPEALYNLETRAIRHQTDRRLVQVFNAQTRELRVFIPRQLVTYTWEVVPTEIPDRYEFTL
ncbi:MAG: hypothetical protein H7210_03090, partial [Pyrinomonadaceae bacterium]|nr:hypothetical protein [Phycisphaerales bacterium]